MERDKGETDSIKNLPKIGEAEEKDIGQGNADRMKAKWMDGGQPVKHREGPGRDSAGALPRVGT